MDFGTLENLRVSRDAHVGWLRLDRPERLNAMTGELWAELREVGTMLRDDPDLRALVVTGEGRAFSSGIDTSVFEGAFGDALSAVGGDDGQSAGTSAALVETIMRTQDAFSWLSDAPFATIAAVRGYALGAGLQLALACDLRVFARGTTVGLLELQYGMMPDLGGTQRLPLLVGAGKAKELIFTGAKIDAEEAHRIGLCEQFVDDEDLDDTVAALANTIAGQPPLAIRGVKDAIHFALEGAEADGLRVEAERQAVCLASDDLAEAMAAFVEQRSPRYRGR
jgi:enoyl-CoA hydratase/carnithine racemase